MSGYRGMSGYLNEYGIVMENLQVWITRDFLFVDLHKKLNSLTSRFQQVVNMYNNTWWN